MMLRAILLSQILEKLGLLFRWHKLLEQFVIAFKNFIGFGLFSLRMFHFCCHNLLSKEAVLSEKCIECSIGPLRSG